MTLDEFLKLLFVFLLAFVPSLIWLSFFLKKDSRPEPRRFLILTFAIGGLITVIGSQAENVWFKPWVQENPNPHLGALLFLFFYPLLEEILKFLSARISTIKNRFFCDEVTDPMVYMITAALGFAAAENLKAYFSTIFGAGGALTWQGLFNLDLSQVVLMQLVLTALIRFLATVFLHALSSGVFGYFWALTRLLKEKFLISILAFPSGLLLATILHSFYNYLIMNIGQGIFYTVTLVVFLVVSGVIVSRAFRQLKNYTYQKQI